MEPILNRLLKSELPYVRYRTRLDLLKQSENDESVQTDRKAMLDFPLVKSLIAQLQDWPGELVSSHKSASQAYHRLTFLAELGVKASDPGIAQILDRLWASKSEDGIFTLPTRIPEAYGGTGQPLNAWALCDAPTLLYAVALLEPERRAELRLGIDTLKALGQDNGWPCAVSKELGSWHGPGRRQDPCPYATLIMLKLLSLSPEGRASIEVQAGVESLLHLWEHSRELHPYIFYMGTDFRKLRLPFIWYDLFHVLEVLSRYPYVFHDPRFLDMLQVLKEKIDAEEQITLESVSKAWADWDFGQKKSPSDWAMFLSLRILKRVDDESI